ncbi:MULTISPECIES: type II toxin-antitoxin system PemK/MazF family toxin [Bacillaceae]|uniref:type II toxin-antitoxin system PemK/MazF family toxin n=1 Tax=Bacillaceae TaxID=186817 RepID=UPI000760D26A|nr:MULTISPECIES: type II toxin-antitoxin system PemK/MazF family toxin [Bacillaceae]HAJ4038280.1 hypothetical protein [Escherichia coli]
MSYKFNRYRELAKWFGFQMKMNENYKGGSGHFFPRKSIVSVFLGENTGYEKNGNRPAIVVSVDSNNKTNGNVLIIPLTNEQNKKGKLLKSQYMLKKSKYKLKYNSIVQCEDMRIVSKERIGNVIDFVDDDDMREIEKRLKYFIGL